MTAHSDQARRDAMRQAVDTGFKELQTIEFNTPWMRSLSKVAFQSQKKDRDPETTLDWFGDLSRDLRQVQNVVDRVWTLGRASERAEAEAFPFQQAWLADRKRQLDDVMEVDDTRAWAQLWLESWMQALAAAEWPAALKIVEWRHRAGADIDELRSEMLSITHDLRAERPPTIAAIDHLLATDKLFAPTHIRLLVLKTRTLLRFFGNPHEAARLATRAKRLARVAGDTEQALTRAVRAEVHLAADELDAAARLVGETSESDESVADLLVVAAQLALRMHDFSRADDLFDACTRRFGLAVGDSHLLSEVSGNLLWSLARQLRDAGDARAVEMYERAIDAGIVGKSELPQRKALIEKAELLVSLNRHADAAAAFAEAGDLSSQLGSERAVSSFERAHELDRENPLYCWSLAEEVRFRAIDGDGHVDADRVTWARSLQEEGVRLAGGEIPTWVMVSIGLAMHALGSDPDPMVWLERAILQRPDSANIYAMLAWARRRDGYPRAAVRAARYGAGMSGTNPFLTTQAVLACFDLGQYDDAAAALAEPTVDTSRVAHASIPAWIELRRQNPLRALHELDTLEIDPIDAALVRLMCYDALGDEAGARESAAAVWAARDSITDMISVGWAAYRLGMLDEAVSRMEESHNTAPDIAMAGLNLGQVLMVRGDGSRNDIDRGRDILLRAIESATIADELISVVEIELPLAARTVSGRTHAPAAEAALKEAATAASVRIQLLQTREPDAGLLSQQLAEARELGAAGDLTAALARYGKLTRQGVVPEATAAMQRMSVALIDVGTAQLARGDLVGAQETWRRVATELLSADPERRLPDDLSARLGFSALELNGPADDHALMNLRASDSPARRAALPHFARTVDLAWTHYDRLQVLAQRLPDSERARFADVAEDLPLDRLLRLRRDDLSARAATPIARASEIIVGGAHPDQHDSEYLIRHIGELRREVTEAFGVWIPGVGVAMAADPELSTVTFRVFEQPVAAIDLPVGPDPGPSIMTTFADVVTNNLFRWFSVDDLDLWNTGWAAQTPAQASLPTDLSDRVRLTRVLRSLLSEGIPISDRGAIVAGFHAAGGDAPDPMGGVDLDAASHAIAVMTEVRRQLYPAILAPGAEQILMLPSELEERVAAGLGNSVWTQSRAKARSLLADLRNWRAGVATDPITILVNSCEVRPYVWRLLAADRPRIYVVAQEEIP